MTVLAHFGHQHARPATVLLNKGFDITLDAHPLTIILVGAAIDTGNGLRLGIITAKLTLHRIGNLTHGGPHAGSLDGQVQQVAAAGFGALVNRFQRIFHGLFIAAVADVLQPFDL